MSDHTNSLTSDHEETTSSQIKTLETSRETETTPRTQTDDCDDDDESGSWMNYNNTVENATNTVDQQDLPVGRNRNEEIVSLPKDTTTTKPVSSCEVSEVYKEFIEENRDIIENKCKKFYQCTRELYKTETLSRILEGEDIQLHNICGLLIKDKDGQHTTKTNECWPPARKVLKQELEEELNTQMEKNFNDDKATWQRLDTCLDNKRNLDTLCRLKEGPTVNLCMSADIESKTEKLFNTKLRTLHCYCELVSPVSPDRSALIGGICGGALVVMMLLAVIAVLYIRQRKLKRRLQSEAQRSVNVMSPADDTFSTYEIVDDHLQGTNAWSGQLKLGPSSDHATPSLPPRDMPSQLPQTTSSGDQHSADPVPDIVFLSPGQGLPAPRGSSTSGSQGSLQDPPYELTVPLTTCQSGISSGGSCGPFQEEEYFQIDRTSEFKEHEDYSKIRFKRLSNSVADEGVGDELQLPISQSTASEDEGQKQSNASQYSGLDLSLITKL